MYRVPPFELELLMRVVRRHPLEDGRVRFSFLRLYPSPKSPEPLEVSPEEPIFNLLMQDLPLYDGRGNEQWGSTVHRARCDESVWLVPFGTGTGH